MYTYKQNDPEQYTNFYTWLSLGGEIKSDYFSFFLHVFPTRNTFHTLLGTFCLNGLVCQSLTV